MTGQQPTPVNIRGLIVSRAENASFQTRCVVFSDGTYWFAKGYDKDFVLGERILQCQKKDVMPVETTRRVVGLGEIRAAYAAPSAANGNMAGGPVSGASLNARFEQAIARAAEARASDLKLELTEHDFTIHAIINDLLHPIDVPWTVHDGHAVMHQIFTMKEQGSGQTSYQERSFQGFSVRPGEKIQFPDSVTAIRGQRGPSDPAGEHMYLRLFYADTLASADLGDLGLDAHAQEAFARARSTLTGLIAIGGVTGDGKSSTMGVNLVMQQRAFGNRLNMVTVEDPVEYRIPGATQIAVSTAVEGDERSDAFMEALRHFCRIHPSSGMVSEIRDSAAAQQVMNFVDTGHQVWTTIHVDSANGIPFRLLNLGVSTAQVCKPGALALLVKQTLVTQLCADCKQPSANAANAINATGTTGATAAGTPIPDWLRDDLGGRDFFVRNPEGCETCRTRHGDAALQQAWWGYSHRRAVAEIITPDMDYLSCVQNNDPVGALRYWLDHMGGLPIEWQISGMVLDGLIDPLDALRKGVRLRARPDNGSDNGSADTGPDTGPDTDRGAGQGAKDTGTAATGSRLR